MSTVSLLAPFAVRLDERRRSRVDELIVEERATVQEISAACARLAEGPDDGAAAAIDRGVAHMLAGLRAAGGSSGALEAVDDVVRSDELEWLDLEWVPGVAKRAGMKLLHLVNGVTGAYPKWSEVLAEALGPTPTRPAHVHDLAAGTGGFARWLAMHPPHGLELRVTSSDLDPGYVALGERAARREHAAVRFETRDALDLRGIGPVDLFVCTQATHHLGPARVLRMIAQAIAHAPRGIVIVDVYRAAGVALGTGAVLALIALPIMRDGVLSVRRSYTPAELALLARLAGARVVRAEPVGAVHCVLHALA